VELWARNCPVILPKFRLPCKFWDLLRAVNLRHGTDGFTSPPKEGVLRIFFNHKYTGKQIAEYNPVPHKILEGHNPGVPTFYMENNFVCLNSFLVHHLRYDKSLHQPSLILP
jgi:hypothetical protein